MRKILLKTLLLISSFMFINVASAFKLMCGDPYVEYYMLEAEFATRTTNKLLPTGIPEAYKLNHVRLLHYPAGGNPTVASHTIVKSDGETNLRYNWVIDHNGMELDDIALMHITNYTKDKKSVRWSWAYQKDGLFLYISGVPTKF
jgi:hypothetical protein